MTIASIKKLVAGSMMAVLAAGTLMIASPATAQAQRVEFGVRVGDPYYAPYYGPRDRFEFERRQEFLRREAFIRHEEWERHHRFDHHYGYR